MHRFFVRNIIALFCMAFCGYVFASEPVVAPIIERIQANGSIEIVQPKAMSNRLVQAAEVAADTETQTSADTERAANGTVGYRIQVFSDANAATAKNEAQVKERNLISRFPTLPTYLTYKAPAWRLRVGDFKNREEAEEMMREIKNAFPSYSRELIIVRDRINL